jgi:hypothetical protein
MREPYKRHPLGASVVVLWRLEAKGLAGALDRA